MALLLQPFFSLLPLAECERERERNMKKPVMAFLPAISVVVFSYPRESFDVREHLSTATRYDVAKGTPCNVVLPKSSSPECTPIHLNLLARHGTRSPTKKRIKEFNDLETRIEVLLQDQKLARQKVPAWFWGWKHPWKGKLTSGELLREGEEEHYNLGIRTRDRFPQLFNEDYHPDVYVIKASQIPRASASAVAFGMGLFSGRGNLGPGRDLAFAVTSESRASDTVLRFHDCCQNYKAFRKVQEPTVHKLKEPIFDEITNALRKRYELNFTRQDISSLWYLCRQEASLLNMTNQACALFTPSEVSLLEWTDDLERFVLKGYGNALNYQMGVLLLEDVVQSMEQAIMAKEEGLAPGTYEKARMRFAHAETLIPFSCLLGLFLERSDFEKIRKQQPLEFPSKLPQRRNWRGSVVAPFAGNIMLVLYSCPDNSSTKYFVQVLHNEQPVPLPGCDYSDVCPFEVFKERIVGPHLKHNYNTLCNPKMEEPEPMSPTSKLSEMFGFSQSSNDPESTKVGNRNITLAFFFPCGNTCQQNFQMRDSGYYHFFIFFQARSSYNGSLAIRS